jgi:hypothetical protein
VGNEEISVGVDSLNFISDISHVDKISGNSNTLNLNDTLAKSDSSKNNITKNLPDIIKQIKQTVTKFQVFILLLLLQQILPVLNLCLFKTARSHQNLVLE